MKFYLNAYTYKYILYKENKNKSGIYLWTNLINNKCYIGSAVKLNKRFSDYYCIDKYNRIRTKGKSLISKAILEYKMDNFSLSILEYCDRNDLLNKEQYYIDLLKPEYNILKIAGSRINYRLSKDTKIALSLKNMGVNNPMYGKYHTNETKLILSLHNIGVNNPMYGKHHTDETKLKIKMSLKKYYEKNNS